MLRLATNPQALIDPIQREATLRMAGGAELQGLLNQVFDAMRLALASALQYGFVTILAFCGITVLAALLLKDLPLAEQFRIEPGEAGKIGEGTADQPLTS